MDSKRSESKRKTKNYLDKDGRERANQRWVEELGSNQTERLHKTESVGQTAWRPYVPTAVTRDDDTLQFKQFCKTCLLSCVDHATKQFS